MLQCSFITVLFKRDYRLRPSLGLDPPDLGSSPSEARNSLKMLLRSSCEEASGFSWTFDGFSWTTAAADVGAGSNDILSSDGEVHDAWFGVYRTSELEAGSRSGPGRLEIMAVGLIMASREKGPSSKGMGHLSMPAIEKEGASPDWTLVVGRWLDLSSG